MKSTTSRILTAPTARLQSRAPLTVRTNIRPTFARMAISTHLPRFVTPIPQVKSNILLPSSYTTYDPSPFTIIPSVIRPSPLVTWRTPKSCKSSGGVEFVVSAPVAREVWNPEFNDARRVLQEIRNAESAGLYALYLVVCNRRALNMAVEIERPLHSG